MYTHPAHLCSYLMQGTCERRDLWAWGAFHHQICCCHCIPSNQSSVQAATISFLLAWWSQIIPPCTVHSQCPCKWNRMSQTSRFHSSAWGTCKDLTFYFVFVARCCQPQVYHVTFQIVPSCICLSIIQYPNIWHSTVEPVNCLGTTLCWFGNSVRSGVGDPR